jgi:multisubunit Na+/H+ antiporter MnhG subunit
VIAALLGLAVAGSLACCFGLLLKRDPVDRLHYAAAAGTLPPALVALAVWLEEGLAQPSLNASLVALALLVLNPVLAHATARVLRKP